MIRATVIIAGGVLAGLLSIGCVAELTPPEPVTIVLANQTGYDVRPALYVSDSAADRATLFTGANLVTTFTDRVFPELRPGEIITLTYECEQLGSLGVSRPRMFDAIELDVTRSDDEIFLLRETDFDCGSTVRFVYFTQAGGFHVRVEHP